MDVAATDDAYEQGCRGAGNGDGDGMMRIVVRGEICFNLALCSSIVKVVFSKNR